jgi:hypothetical protein
VFIAFGSYFTYEYIFDSAESVCQVTDQNVYCLVSCAAWITVSYITKDGEGYTGNRRIGSFSDRNEALEYLDANYPIEYIQGCWYQMVLFTASFYCFNLLYLRFFLRMLLTCGDGTKMLDGL